MRSIVKALILSLTIILFPKRCFACGTCVDYTIDYFLPFFKYWIPLFLMWALLYWRGKILFYRSKGESSLKYIILSILIFFGFLIITSFISMGSALFPFLILFLWWLINSILISVGRYPQKSYQAPWWQNINRIMIGLTIILTAYSYAVKFSDLDRLSKFIRYPGGPYRTVKQKVIRIGKPAIPMVIDELIIKKAEAVHRRESNYKEGIYIIEKITHQNFEGSREKLLKWWDQIQVRKRSRGYD